MVEPTVIPRSEHAISRKDIDPDALKVLYRLHQFNYLAYLVGGSVRDLLLGRRPKDFDIGTSAHPYQVKRLFRNCWIIGRRFRLAHVKFGQKTIEVATFRRQLPPDDPVPETEAELAQPGDRSWGPASPRPGSGQAAGPSFENDAPANEHEPGETPEEARERLIRRDNTFGTPEEDAFRRDFTVNALFYDIATFSVIDYVGGLKDLQERTIRSIGDPEVRFHEDPVRMLRSVVLAERLGFSIDEPIAHAIAAHRSLISHSAPPRLLEELYKILRAGASARTLRRLAEIGLLQEISPELDVTRSEPLAASLDALDTYRRRFDAAPEALSNAVLLGSLLVPLGRIGARGPRHHRDDPQPIVPDAVTLGILPVARRDVERLRQMLALQRRLLDVAAPPRAQRALVQRHGFHDGLTWLEIHGRNPELVGHWRALMALSGAVPRDDVQMTAALPRRRRRRRRGRRLGNHQPQT